MRNPLKGITDKIKKRRFILDESGPSSDLTKHSVFGEVEAAPPNAVNMQELLEKSEPLPGYASTNKQTVHTPTKFLVDPHGEGVHIPVIVDKSFYGKGEEEIHPAAPDDSHDTLGMRERMR